MTEIVGTFGGRWYVTLFGAVYVWQASKHIGWRNTAIYTVVALAVGGAAENGSVHFGFPYTTYAFDPALRGKEIFLGDVPLMVPMSYTFMGYFGFAAGRLVASGPWRTRARHLWQEYLIGLVLSVWALWIFDPVARLGDRWLLGELFRYKGPGFWFGLPLGSQLGFTLTAAVLLGVLTWMMRDEPDVAVARWKDHPHLVALATYHGQIIWLAAVAIYLHASELGGSAALMYMPAAVVTAILWSNLNPYGRADLAAAPAAIPADATP